MRQRGGIQQLPVAQPILLGRQPQRLLVKPVAQSQLQPVAEPQLQASTEPELLEQPVAQPRLR
eukprot:scaffold301596_cov46-Prasinocladus_malaysianus.AAC.1